MSVVTGESKRSLDVLPQWIADAHRRLRDAIDTLCVLEDFLLGSQVREVGPIIDKEAPSGIVVKCFDNLTEISNSIEECHNQLRHIIDKLGVPGRDEPMKR